MIQRTLPEVLAWADELAAHNRKYIDEIRKLQKRDPDTYLIFQTLEAAADFYAHPRPSSRKALGNCLRELAARGLMSRMLEDDEQATV